MLLLCLFQDFVPSKDVESKYERPDRGPENGGLSPRFAARIRNPTTLPTPPMSGSSGVNPSPSSSEFERQFMRVLQKVYQTIEKNEMRLAEQDRRDAIKVEWQQVALVVDRILLFVFIVATMAVTLGIMLHAPQARVFFSGGKSENAHSKLEDAEAAMDGDS